MGIQKANARSLLVHPSKDDTPAAITPPVLSRAMDRAMEKHQSSSFAELARLATKGGHSIGHATLIKSARERGSYLASLDSVLAISYLASVHPITLLRAVEKERTPSTAEILSRARSWHGYSLLGRYRLNRMIPLGKSPARKQFVPINDRDRGLTLIRWALANYETDLDGLERLGRSNGHSTTAMTFRSLLLEEHFRSPRRDTIRTMSFLTDLSPADIFHAVGYQSRNPSAQ